MSTATASPQLIDSYQLSKILVMSRRDLSRLQKQGKIPRALPFSRKPLRWLKSDIDQWLDAQREAAHAG